MHWSVFSLLEFTISTVHMALNGRKTAVDILSLTHKHQRVFNIKFLTTSIHHQGKGCKSKKK